MKLCIFSCNFCVAVRPVKISLSFVNATYKPGTQLIAYVVSNPSISRCTWINVSTTKMAASSCRLRLTERMVGSQMLRVNACNTIPRAVPEEKCITAEFNITVIKRKRSLCSH